MPASPEEALRIVGITREYLPDTELLSLLVRLENEVGTRTDNESLRLTLTGLRMAADHVCASPRPAGWTVSVAFYALVLAHVALIVLNAAAFCVLPFWAPWYYAAPLCTFLVLLISSNWTCPLTEKENTLRRRLGLREIRGFFGHYFLLPWRRMRRFRHSHPAAS